MDRFCEASLNEDAMFTCPVCKKELPGPAPRCPRCQADLSLLADYMTDLRALLDRADAHRRAGELAPAVQAYLDVLEVDPTNAEARAALGPVLRALRVTDRLGGRRPGVRILALVVFTVGVAAGAFALGYWFAVVAIGPP